MAFNTTHVTVRRPGRWRVVATALVAGLFLAGCGSTTTTPSPATTATPTAAAPAASKTPSPTTAACQAAADLRASVNALTHVTIGKDTVNEISADLADVEAKLTALTAELHNAYGAQTSAVKSALDAFKTAVSDLSANPGTSTVTGVATALGGVTAAVGNLVTSLNPQCGSATATPSP